MITKSFYSLQYQDAETFEKAVSDYGTEQEAHGFEVEVETTMQLLLVPQNVNPITDARGKQTMNAAVNVITCKTVNSYQGADQDEEEFGKHI